LEEPETVPLTRLVIISPYAEEPYEVLMEHDEITIGRAGSSDVLLDHDNSTSRHHALLKHEGDHYVLYDRRSANGVFVNGQMLIGEIGYVLEDGDHISIGNYELIFRCKRPVFPDETEEAASSEAVTSWSFF
jgi:pSer/pThr/pTyr-binding forkhead associated (FHA) protein